MSQREPAPEILSAASAQSKDPQAEIARAPRTDVKSKDFEVENEAAGGDAGRCWFRSGN